jgi:hypothetical protein
MSDGEPVEPQRVEQRQRLMDELWPCPPPPADFAQRVLAQSRAPEPKPERRGPLLRRWPLVAAFAGGAVALALGIVLMNGARFDTSAGRAIEGHVVSESRQTIDIGERALAVAESGSALAWTSGRDGAVRVEQSWGDVFYRVSQGGPFLVRTPVGEVEVTGTCFRIALVTASQGQDQGERSMLVEVFEGGVRARSGTNEITLRAGERARLQPDRIPLPLERPLSGATAGGADGDGAISSSLDELRARERASRARSLQLEARLRELERSVTRPGGNTGNADGSMPPRSKLFDFTPEERRALAARCQFRWSIPRHLTQWAPPEFDQSLIVDPVERAAIVRVIEDQRTTFIEQLRAIYTEVAGDAATAAKLSPMSLHHEIDGKTPKPDGVQARQLILLEWSGARTTPTEAELALRPAVERYWRLMVNAADDTIHRLTPVVGLDRARALTRELVDTGVYGREPGCPSRDPNLSSGGREQRN